MSDTDAAEERPPRSARLLVGVLLVLMLVPGLIGFDAWPLTAWRLFSAARDDTQTRWEIDAVADGSATTVDLDELSIAYRNAEWPLSELSAASEQRKTEVCLALLDGVADEVPGTHALHIVRNERQLVQRGGDWMVLDDRQTVFECGPELVE